jgi:hypothetical protein
MLIWMAGLLPANVRAGARNPCLEPGNLTFNCSFDTFADHTEGEKRYQVPAGWWLFVLAGDLDYRPADDTYWGAPSLWMLSDGVPFTAGIFQQVQVTPGVVYQTDIGWAAVTQKDFERKLGLDPTGGTDPTASTVIWGRSEWGMDPWPDLTVSARATGPTMTVFVWVHHPATYGNDWIFLDAVGLWPDASQPAATLTPTPTPVPTRKPPTRTPTPVPPTYTPTPLPATPTATATATPWPTDTPRPSDTPQPTATPVPSETPTPAWTPTRTPVPVARLGRSQEVTGAAASSGSLDRKGDAGVVFLYVAAGAVAVAVSLVAVVIAIWLRGRRSAGDPE